MFEKEGKGGFGRERNARGGKQGERETAFLSLPPRAPPRVSLAPKTPFPLSFKTALMTSTDSSSPLEILSMRLSQLDWPLKTADISRRATFGSPAK